MSSSLSQSPSWWMGGGEGHPGTLNNQVTSKDVPLVSSSLSRSLCLHLWMWVVCAGRTRTLDCQMTTTKQVVDSSTHPTQPP